MSHGFDCPNRITDCGSQCWICPPPKPDPEEMA